jgi:glycosyltransferase involved in cell wall biosynthesis
MNIIILLPDARMGGAQNVLLQLADEFRINHSVEFLCLAQAGELHKNSANNLRMRFLVNNDRLGFSALLEAFHRLIGIMRTDQDAVILSTGTGTNLLACAARLFARRGARLVIREACSSKNSTSRIISLLKRLLYPRADGMIGVSDGVAEELKALAGKRQPIASIPNPVDALRLNALAAMPDGALADFPHAFILTVGRLVPQKNTALLIDAFARIEKSEDEHLVIIGGGPLESQLRSQIANYGLDAKIHLLGEISNPHPWYRKASAFVLSSGWEGYPNVLIEALAHGVKVVSTDCEFGPNQILAQGKFGTLVPVCDIDAMADAICMLLKDKTAFDTWQAENFNVSRVATRYLAFMESC